MYNGRQVTSTGARVRRLIVNADDFGLSPGVNRGIVRAACAGVVTNTSIMANAPAFEEAVELARATPGLGVGVHLNLTAFAPLTGAAAASLVDEEGRFLPHRSFIMRMLGRGGGANKEQLQAELRVQVTRCVEAGLRLTHFDSHQHIHIFPSVFQCMLDLALEFKVPCIRVTQEKMPEGLEALGKEGWKRRVFGWNAARYRSRLRQQGLKQPDKFWGLDSRIGRAPLDAFTDIVQGLDEGDHELMCHPGEVDEDLCAADSYTDRRARELEALCSPDLRAEIESQDIRLIRYDEL